MTGRDIHILQPRELSEQLRHGSDGYLGNRRAVVTLSLLSMGCMGLISLYQLGIIKHIPEPTLPKLDADKVDASEEAYGHLQMGDAFIGMVSYSITAALAAAGGPGRAKSQPLIPLALAAKAGIDLLQACRLTYNQFAKQKAACFWCLLAATSTLATAILAAPEARIALERGR